MIDVSFGEGGVCFFNSGVFLLVVISVCMTFYLSLYFAFQITLLLGCKLYFGRARVILL